MNNVVFLVKNGIGFGHIRRAMLLAEELESQSRIRPIVVSQAHSLDLYRSAAVRVVNFPLLHRVPSAILEDCYLDILNQLMVKLTPSVVVEDTYPDPRYGALPALRGVPRILVMRRLDGISLDQFRERGAFARYARILIAQSHDEFLSEDHSAETVTAAELSDQVEFVGNIHHTPTEHAINRVRQRFCADGRPLVVVNAGAGGDQLHDGFGDRLFGHTVAVADALRLEGHPAQFVVVTGPYYAGRPLVARDNVTVRHYDPDLPALLAAADVAVIKPGNNSLSEALVGQANLVLVPDASFMEGVRPHAERIAATFGGTVTTPDFDGLDQAIRAALQHPPRTRRPTPSREPVQRVLDTITEHAAAPPPSIRPKQLTLLVRTERGVSVASTSARPQDWDSLTSCDASSLSETVLVRPDGLSASPQTLVDRGARVLLVCGGDPDGTVQRWLRKTPAHPALVTVDGLEIPVALGRVDAAVRFVSRYLASRTYGALVLDASDLDEEDAAGFVKKLLDWIATQAVELVEPRTLASHAADAMFGVAQ